MEALVIISLTLGKIGWVIENNDRFNRRNTSALNGAV